MRERRRVRAGLPLVLAVGVAALGGIAWYGWRAEPVVPPSASTSAAIGATPGTAAVSGIAAAAASAPAERDAVPPCGVRGVVLDGTGRPLADWPVHLEHPVERPHRRTRASFGPGFRLEPPAVPLPDRNRRSQTSDAHGAFVFDDVPPGTCTVWLEGAHEARVELELVVGEPREIELRLPDRQCAVTCMVRSHGVAQGWTEILAVLANRSEVHLRTDGEGRARGLLPAGAHELFAYGDRDASTRDRRYVRGRHSLLIPTGTNTMKCAFDLDGASLAVVVEDAGGVPFVDLTVEVTGTSRHGEDLSFRSSSRTGRGGLDLLPGHWTVAVRAPELMATPPQSITIEPGQGRAEVQFVGRRGAVVRLALRHFDGSPYRRALPVEAPLDYLSALWNGDLLVPCLDPSDSYSATKLTLGSIPLGNGTIEWRDREVDGAQVFLPFEPVAPMPVTAQAGARNAMVVVVEPRAFVELIGCESMGRELVSGCVRVFAGSHEVRSLAKERPARWRSFLPPGEYRVCIDHDAGTTERLVTVQRRDLTLRLRR